MGDRIGSDPVLMSMSLGWSLNLTAQRRQLLQRKRLLQVAAPFLTLGGSLLLRAVAARSLSLLTVMPWLSNRWLEWPIFPSETVHTHTHQQQVQIHSQPKIHKPSLQKVHLSIGLTPLTSLLGELPGSVPLSQTLTEAVSKTIFKIEYATANRGFPELALSLVLRNVYTRDRKQGHVRSQSASLMPSFGGLRLPINKNTILNINSNSNLNPNFNTNSNIDKLIEPIQPVEQELLQHSLPKASNTRTTKLLSKHKLPSLEKGVAGLIPLHGLNMVMETIRHTMKREVTEAIKQQAEVLRPPLSSQASVSEMFTAENLVSDNNVRLFIQKMRNLAEEERFRLGLLR